MVKCVFFPWECAFTFVTMPNVDFLLLVIQLFLSVPSCPYKKDGAFADTNLQQLEGRASVWKLCWFCHLWRLETFSLSASLLQRLLDCIRHGFQHWYLANLWKLHEHDLFRFHGSADRVSDMSTGNNWYWGTDLACEIKPSHKFLGHHKFHNYLLHTLVTLILWVNST